MPEAFPFRDFRHGHLAFTRRKGAEVSETYDTDRPGTEEDEGEQRGTTAKPSGQHGEPGRQAEEREREDHESYGGQAGQQQTELPREHHGGSDDESRTVSDDRREDRQAAESRRRSGQDGGDSARQGGMVDTTRQND
jgi:hypothetical protein